MGEQLLGKGCVADKKFFDINKKDVEVAAPRGSDQVKAACCTAFTNAKCIDWAVMMGVCPSGKDFVGGYSAPADGANGMTLTKSKYHKTCCVEAPKRCSSYSAVWLTAQLIGQGCVKDKMFFDTKKLTDVVTAPAGDDQVKAACCTAFKNAKCSDWAALLGVCPSGKDFVGKNSAPADGANGMTLTKSKYHKTCCVERPKKCSTYSAKWLSAQLTGTGCAKDKMFFDTKKLAVVVAGADDAQVKAACCTAFADAKCSDWFGKSCASGTWPVATNSAPADSSDGKKLSLPKFRESCCKTPMKCEAYTAATEASRSMSQATVSIVALAGVLAAWVGA